MYVFIKLRFLLCMLPITPEKHLSWAAGCFVNAGRQLGVRCLAQGHHDVCAWQGVEPVTYCLKSAALPMRHSLLYNLIFISRMF